MRTASFFPITPTASLFPVMLPYVAPFDYYDSITAGPPPCRFCSEHQLQYQPLLRSCVTFNNNVLTPTTPGVSSPSACASFRQALTAIPQRALPPCNFDVTHSSALWTLLSGHQLRLELRVPLQSPTLTSTTPSVESTAITNSGPLLEIVAPSSKT